VQLVGRNCSGCGYVKGKPFWAECHLYPRVREKAAEHCGLCRDLPCEHFLATYDPGEGKWRVFYRAGQLAYRKKVGAKVWTEEKAIGENPNPKHKE
jgi:hypothetical protein